MNQSQIQMVVPELSYWVKRLIIINVVIWAVFILIIQNFFMDSPLIFEWFGLVPAKSLYNFFVWQPFSYMFVHSRHIFHIIFNMLTLWWLGSDLETRWGSRFFIIYYLVCGIGAGFLYLLGVSTYALISGNMAPLHIPVVGASGAIFGLIFAYGAIFGERMVYFMMIFPMKAKVFVALLAFIEVFSLLSSGFGSNVANLAHLGGFIVGWLFLLIYTRMRGKRVRSATKKHGRKLKLVVDNEKKASPQGPKYWN